MSLRQLTYNAYINPLSSSRVVFLQTLIKKKYEKSNFKFL
jgi:hypothetical protein